MTERELCKELECLRALPATVDDWRDLYETIEAYMQRCLARAIAQSSRRAEIVEAIKTLAEVS